MVEPEGRSARKRQAILDAAAATFLEHGFVGTTMDQIAAVAGVSKQTVYKHFGDKQALFTAAVVDIIENAARRSADEMAGLAAGGDLQHGLEELARATVRVLTAPPIVRWRRLIIGEADRFPDLARTWHERAIEAGYRSLAALLAELDAQGRLRVDDPLRAAQHFHWLALSVPMNTVMFIEKSYSAQEIDDYATSAVRVFLAAYGVSRRA